MNFQNTVDKTYYFFKCWYDLSDVPIPDTGNLCLLLLSQF